MINTNDINPGDTIIVRRHYTMNLWQAGWETRKLVIANDTAASFISRTETTVTVILSGGCRGTYPISAITRLDEYVPGLTPHSLIDPIHEDDVQTREHADYAIACAQQA